MVFAACTHEQNWLSLQQLKKECAQLKIGFGIHPWFTDHDRTMQDRLKTLANLLAASPKSFLGEIGLDKSPKWRGTFDRQQMLFEAQLQMARHYKRPIVAHVVKAHEEAIPALNSHPEKVYIHGFVGSPETMKRYRDAYFGININTLRSRKTQMAIAIMPENAILAESDNRPNLNTLNQTVSAIAKIRNWPVEKTKIICTKNARSWLGISP